MSTRTESPTVKQTHALTLRVPQEIFVRLEKLATRERRSLSGQILRAVERELERHAPAVGRVK